MISVDWTYPLFTYAYLLRPPNDSMTWKKHGRREMERSDVFDDCLSPVTSPVLDCYFTWYG